MTRLPRRWSFLCALALAGCGRSEEPSENIDPGRVVAHRLNRAEYDNTVRDLFGTELRPALDFPSDDFGYGFDNIALVLSVSPLHAEMYERAADQLLDELFGVGFEPAATWRFEAEAELDADVGGPFDNANWLLSEAGSVSTRHYFDQGGTYTLAMWGFGQQAGDEDVRMAFVVDGAVVAELDVVAEQKAPERLEVTLPLTQGTHEVGITFLNDYKRPPDEDRNLVVDWLEIVGPHDVARVPPAGASRVLSCSPDSGESTCAAQIVGDFARRAWRRKLSASDLERAMRPYGIARGLGEPWEDAVRQSLKGVLISPDFLYRIERDPLPNMGPRPLDGFELASRLSYFLWSTTPDDRLLDLAESGRLTDPVVLEAEARRLLSDPRAAALVDNLGGQWLGIRKVEEGVPSVDLFPAFDEGLRGSMEEEMRRFVASVLLGDAPLTDLLTSRQTEVDARLAEHYGVPAPASGWAPVEIPQRPGLLAKSGWLMATSYPTRTSPVLRGVWVLDNLLCSPPPAPPPGVEGLDTESPEAAPTIREQLEQHRSDPSCAACHNNIDPIGLGLENFDVLGQWRDEWDGGYPVDASGEIAGEGSFEGVEGLVDILAKDPAVTRCAVRKTFTYALGRSPEGFDGDALERLEVDFARSGLRFRELAVAVVLSEPFRYRRGEK